MKKNPKVSIHMDPTLPEINYEVFDMKYEGFEVQYHDAEEQLTPDISKLRGVPVTVTACVDASHATNRVTRKSHTSFLIFFCKLSPIMLYSKRQQTIESGAFLSEFSATKTCIEAIRGLRYKFCVFGIPIMNDEP